MPDSHVLPPPLPSAPLPRPRADDGSATKFVTMTAKMGLVLGGLSVLWSLVQLALAGVLQRATWPAALDSELVEIPRTFAFVIEHAVSLSLACLVISIAFTAACWGLLKRRRWGHAGVIFFLVVIALANFAALPLLHGFYDDLANMFPPQFYQQEEGQLFLRQIQTGRWSALIFSGFAALCIAALHGWLVLKLRKPDVRAQFE